MSLNIFHELYRDTSIVLDEEAIHFDSTSLGLNVGLDPYHGILDSSNYLIDGLIPASIGNSWTYQDTVWTTSGVEVSQRTVEITQVMAYQEKYWWCLTRSFPIPFYLGPFHTDGDTITCIQQGMWGDYQSVEFHTTETVDSLYVIVEGDILSRRYISKGTSPIRLGSEYIDEYYLFSGRNIESTDYEINIAPGIGVISSIMEYDTNYFFHTGDWLKWSSTLIEYDVAQME